MELNKIQSSGNWGKAAGDLNQNFSKVNNAVEQVKNATTRNKGYFSSSSELASMYPTASVNDIAYVDDGGTDYLIYQYNGSAWEATGKRGGEGVVELGNYYDKQDIDNKMAATDEKLSELGSEIGGEVNLTKSINGSISSDNTWVEGTHTIINLYPYDKVTIQTSSSVAVYALLKTYSTSVVEYVEGTGRTTMPSHRTVEFIVDEKCYLYIHKVGNNGTDYTPLSVNIKNRLERLSENDKDYTKELNKLQHETVGNIVSPKGSGYISTKVDIGTVVNEKVTSDSNFAYYVFNVDATKKLEITGHGGVNGLLWAFVDDNNLLISRSLGGLVLNKEIVDVPENANKAIINVRVSSDYEIRVLSLYSTRARIASIDNKMNSFDFAFGNINYSKGFITTGDVGATIPSYTSNGQSYWVSSVIPVKEGDTFYIEGQGGNNARLWAFIDENDAVLSSSSANYISVGENIIAPIGSKVLIVNFGTASYSPKYELYIPTRFDNKIGNLPIENIKEINVLVFGNSYSYRSTAQGSGNILNLFKSLNIPVFLCVVGNPGATFESNYTKHINGEINEYRWEGDINSGVSNKTTEGFTYIDALKYKKWDYIIYHQASTLSGNISSFSPYLQELIDVAKIHCDNENVKFGLMQTWAYANNPSTYPTSNSTEPVFDSQVAMYNAICETYRQALSQFDDISFIVPAGTALQNARNTDLGNSYDDFASSNTDASHINNYGTLITALVYFNKIYGNKNNVSLSKVSNTYSSLLTDDEFEIAKKCAKKAILHPFGVL